MKINSLSILPLLLLTLAGCATNSTPPNPNIVQIGGTVLKVAAKDGAVFAMQKDANTRAYFAAATVALDALLDSGAYDAAGLAAALDTISVSEIRDSAPIKSAIGDILDIYRATEADVVSQKLDTVQYLRPALTAVRDGFQAALAL